MFYPGNWIDSFADNYQFSNATLITKGMAPWNAVALGEIDEVIQRLHERPIATKRGGRSGARSQRAWKA